MEISLNSLMLQMGSNKAVMALTLFSMMVSAIVMDAFKAVILIFNKVPL